MKQRIAKLSESQWLHAFLVWSIILIAVIAAAQLVISVPEAPQSKFFENIFEPCYSRNNDGQFTAQKKDLPEVSFAVPKPADTYRTFIIGGSVANNFRSPVYTEGFKLALAQMCPGKKIELINAALPAYDSFRVLRVLREVTNYEPDCFIIMSGNNEFYNQGLGIRDLLRYRLGGLRLFRLRHQNIIQEFINPSDTARTTKHRLMDYRANISKMVNLAKKHAQHTVLCTLPINSRDFAPKGPFPAHAQYIKASLALLKEDFPTAQANAEEYIKRHPGNALGYYLLGRITLAQGKDNRADTFFDTAINLDYGTNPRTIPAANSIVRRVAQEQGVMLADTAEDIRALRKKGVPDWQIFKDICHLRETARPVMFNSIVRTLAPSAAPMPLQTGTTDDDQTQLQFAWFALGDIDSPDTFLSEQSFSKFRLIYLAQGLKTIEHYLDSKQELLNHTIDEAAAKPKPDWRVLDANTGECLRRLGQPEEALEYLNKARDEGLKTAPLYISLALIMHNRGNKKEAVQYINTALNYAKQDSLPLAEAVREIILNPEK